MNEELMNAIMGVFIKQNIRGEEQLREMRYICGAIEEALGVTIDSPIQAYMAGDEQ